MKIPGERTFFTRNRRGEPATTLMDEYVDGKPTGRIVRGYGIGKDGSLEVDYQENTVKEPAMSSGYIGVQAGLEHEVRSSVREAIRAGKPITTDAVSDRTVHRVGELPAELIQAILDADISHLEDYDYEGSPSQSKGTLVETLPEPANLDDFPPMHIDVLKAAVEARTRRVNLHAIELPAMEVARKQRVTVEEQQELTAVYVLEFDGPCGVERKEFSNPRAAREYPEFINEYYKHAPFSNFRLFREYRTPREQLTLGDK